MFKVGALDKLFANDTILEPKLPSFHAGRLRSLHPLSGPLHKGGHTDGHWDDSKGDDSGGHEDC